MAFVTKNIPMNIYRCFVLDRIQVCETLKSLRTKRQVNALNINVIPPTRLLLRCHQIDNKSITLVKKNECKGTFFL